MDFKKLTPIDSANINTYEEALDFVFANDDIHNVAISGAYSAGKSSIIESYKKKHNKSFMHLSLAHFESTEEAKTANTNNKTKESVLEGKILNQLIQQIDPSRIPQTNFRVKHSYSFIKKFLFSSAIVAITLLIFYIINFTNWVHFLNSFEDGLAKTVIVFLTGNSVNRLLALFVLITIVIFGLFRLISVQLNKGIFKKVSVQGNEIEIFEEDNDSYFDKYLNEVLYLFEKANTEVFVFEDMDRYNYVQIFQRLREINTLVNKKRKKENKSPIRFFYLLRDDIFISKDRTKFFDFIIPVVPVIDGSNSYDLLLNYFVGTENDNTFDKGFLQGVSLYIDDMRILKNIYNEFAIYQNRIGTTEQDVNKLLAIIIYKNLFPRDFSDLQLNKGFVYQVFADKQKYIEAEVARLQSEIDSINADIQVINNDCMKSETEIDRLYTHSAYQNTNYYGNKSIKPEFEQEKQKRKKLLKLNQEAGIEQLHQHQSKIKDQIIALQEQKLSDIINKENIDSIFQITAINEMGEKNDFAEIKCNEYFDLLKYLIRNGYIDETYSDYMTYFYEGSLSKADKIFLRSITDQKAKPYNYKLIDPHTIIQRLTNKDYKSPEILNYDLLNYLLSYYKSYASHVYAVIDQVKDNQASDFILGYSSAGSEVPRFIDYLCKIWTGFFDVFFAFPNYSTEDKKTIAWLILCYAKESLLSVNENGTLSDFIENYERFLDIDEPKTDLALDSFEDLNIKFRDLDFTVSNPGLLKKIYFNNFYRLNWTMIIKIILHFYRIEKNDSFDHQNLTIILSRKDSRLCSYVKENIDEYMEEYIDNCRDRIADHESTVYYVINNKDISKIHKSEYTKLLVTKVSSISRITDVSWQHQLMNLDLVVFSEDNLLDYYNKKGKIFDDTLIRFINKYAVETAFEKITHDGELNRNERSEFFFSVLKCSQLDNEKYKMILSVMNLVVPAFKTEDVPDDKITILVELGIIKMNTENLLFMRKSYPRQVMFYIESNIKEYANQVISKDTFELEEAVALLSAKVSTKLKLKVLSCTKEPVSIRNKGYNKEIDAYILSNNFDIDDLPNLLSNYESYSEECKSIIRKKCVEYTDEIISEDMELQYNLLIQLISQNEIDTENVLYMFSCSVVNYDIDQTKTCLGKISIFHCSRVSVPHFGSMKQIIIFWMRLNKKGGLPVIQSKMTSTERLAKNKLSNPSNKDSSYDTKILFNSSFITVMIYMTNAAVPFRSSRIFSFHFIR